MHLSKEVGREIYKNYLKMMWKLMEWRQGVGEILKCPYRPVGSLLH